MSEWVYNDRPDGVRFLPDRITEPARTEIEDEIWAWIVRGEDDAELNQLGVLARESFTCCGTCAAAEIHDERDEDRHWHGYLWYHQQDTESQVSSPDGSVYLGYGAYPPEDFDEAAYDALSEDEKRARYQADVERLLDERVFPVLREHGMKVEWNRDQATRILLTGARWYAPLS